MSKNLSKPATQTEPAFEAGHHEALAATHAISSVGVGMLTMLETLLPAAASEVERESLAMANHFSTLVDYISSQKDVPSEVASAITGVIIGMQFQDRNTQIMENVASMLERYRSMLEEVCDKIELSKQGKSPAGHDVTLAVETILSGIRLSEIRSRYLAALAKTKHAPASKLMDIQAEEAPDDVELF